jgi:hypothetical protein
MMNRLTQRDRYGCCFCGVYFPALDLDVKDNRILRSAAALLAAYEDTGLTPDEISALRAENERLRAALETSVPLLQTQAGVCGLMGFETSRDKLRAAYEAARAALEGGQQ